MMAMATRIAAFCVAMAILGCAYAHEPTLTTMRLDFDDGTCSGTVVAPSVILSAGHCFETDEEENDWGWKIPAPTSVLVDGYKVNILAVVKDGNDHALAKVDFVFSHYERIHKAPQVGAKVHWWGNPGGLNNVYREGYIASYHHSDMIMDINGFFGDSGAGVFNEFEELVGVVSYINVNAHEGMKFTLMGAKALEFTPLQYDMMGVKP